jgi:SecD/SecF fusion protein
LINKSWEFNKIVDTALNSTLSRTLNTSFTTLVVLLAIFLFGGESIQGFMFALIIGVIVGTYSSVFIATPVMYETLKKSLKK